MPLIATTIALSSFLSFLVQPIASKFMLPIFGGSAAVWTTCLLFFQVTLCLGYGYSYLCAKLPNKIFKIAHSAAVIAALLCLPILQMQSAKITASQSPQLDLLVFLAQFVFLPYFILTTTTPLLHRFAFSSDTGSSRYWLYSLSNACSFLALGLYSPIIEPNYSLQQQSTIWSTLFAGYLACLLLFLWRNNNYSSKSVPSEEACMPSSWRHKCLWLCLSFLPSGLLLSYTNLICQEIAPIPLLWTFPLGIYLLTFVLAFSERLNFNYKLCLSLLIIFGASVVYQIIRNPIANAGPATIASLVGLFAICLLCHSALSFFKPSGQSELPFFYVLISIGGAIGGVFVAVVSPLIFSSYIEHVILQTVAIAACFLLLLRTKGRDLPSKLDFRAVTALTASCLVLLCCFSESRFLKTGRNFYGVLRLLQNDNQSLQMYHGNTLHGVEYTAPPLAGSPTAYYGKSSGSGAVFSALAELPSRRVAIIGLGVGTIASYGRPTDEFTFFELNPMVAELAQSSFHYLSSSSAKISIVLGDGRQSLENERPNSFDALIVDAFSGDTIPTHLLTQEAIRLYLSKIKQDGIIAFHISNRHIDLSPVVLGTANSVGLYGRSIIDSGNSKEGTTLSSYILLGSASSPINSLSFPGLGEVKKDDGNWKVWTDSFSDLFSILMHF